MNNNAKIIIAVLSTALAMVLILPVVARLTGGNAYVGTRGQGPSKEGWRSPSPQFYSQERVALVIGIADYDDAPLKNPVNDAMDISKALQLCGFSVLEKHDCTYAEMENALDEFGEEIQNAGIAMFYYSGHGIQVNGENYLVPSKASLKTEGDIRTRCTNAETVLAKMRAASTRVNIVVLDACRNNPLLNSLSGARGLTTRGLAPMTPAAGSLIAYSTAPGSVAYDGEGKNSYYTSSLIEHIATPGLAIEQVFKRVREDVLTVSQHRQIPWEHSSLIGDFYFAERTPLPMPSPAHEPVQQAALTNEDVAVAMSDIDVPPAIDPTHSGGAPTPTEPFVSVASNWVVNEGAWAEFPDYAVATLPSGDALEFLPVEPGEYYRGSNMPLDALVTRFGGEPRDYADEFPRHLVRLSRGYFLMKTEVTKQQFEVFVNITRYVTDAERGNPAWMSGNPPVKTTATWRNAAPDTPAVYVSWNDANAFCSWLSRFLEKQCRLPTGAEWEYACRAGSDSLYAFGNSDSQLGAYAWISGNSSGRVRAAATRQPNAWGFHDMHGNVWEWCADWSGIGDYQEGVMQDPFGAASMEFREVRGGSAGSNPGFCRSSGRWGHSPHTSWDTVGFRVLVER